MDERFFARLATRLQASPATDLVLASVLQTEGATPRKSGSRMLVSATDAEFSVGGGQLEARVLRAARELLISAGDASALHLDLHGKSDSAGVCGGRLRVGLRRWRSTDLSRATEIANSLSAGALVALSATEQGGTAADQSQLQPNPRLLIVGAGHCGQALYQAAQSLDFNLWIHDSRADSLRQTDYPEARCLCGAAELLTQADSPRPLYAVLLNRDYPADVAALRALLPLQPAFVGMMGSRRRVAQVYADPALRGHADSLDGIHAPVGLPINAHTPEEIAVSILAQLIAYRARP